MEEIPPGQYQYPAKPAFVRYPKDPPGEWHVWGPIDKVRVGEPVEVYKFSENTTEVVEILDIVADRHVLKRNGFRIRYVMAIFDRVAEEVNDGDSN